MIALKILYLSVLILALLFLYVRFYEAKGLFLPDRRMAGTPASVALSFEDVFFLSDTVKLNGWLIKSASPEQSPTVLFLHGNAGNISHRLDKIGLLHQLGLNVFIIDYRGYGKSEGRSNEVSLYADAAAAADYLARRGDINYEQLIVYGESLGSAAAIDLASKRKVAALVTESAFTSAADMARVILPVVPTAFLKVRLDSVAKIKDIPAPKLLIHSRDDEIVPFKLAQKLFDAASSPKELLVIDGDHNGAYALSYELYRDGIKHFLNKHGLCK